MRIGTSSQVLMATTQARGARADLESQVDQLCLSSQEGAQQACSAYNKELALKGLGRAAFGGAAGFALLADAKFIPHSEIVGPLFGAGVGLYTAWESLHRQQTGKVEVELDGQAYQKKFAGDARHVALTPEEARFQLLAEGAPSPSRIKPLPPSQTRIPEPTSEQLAPWKEQAPELRALGEQRRLVASFGKVTEDKQPVVHLVDAVNAAKLAASGATVYVVNAQKAQDIDHSLSMKGFNVAHSKATSEQYRYLERAVEYSLTPLDSPARLTHVPAAQGVPEGMFGLLEKSGRYGEVVNHGQSQAESISDSPEFGTRPTRHRDDYSYSSHKRLQGHHMDLDDGLTTVQHVNLPALLGLVGACAGMMTAMSLTGPGVPGPSLMLGTVGFLGGRAAGRALTGG